MTEILQVAGDLKIEFNGKKLTRKEALAELMWQLVTKGEVEFAKDKKLVLDPQDLLGVAKFLYSHIDGPPKAELDVTSDGEQIAIAVIKMDVDEL